MLVKEFMTSCAYHVYINTFIKNSTPRVFTEKFQTDEAKQCM
jgi:hypothetical protein